MLAKGSVAAPRRLVLFAATEVIVQRLTFVVEGFAKCLRRHFWAHSWVSAVIIHGILRGIQQIVVVILIQAVKPIVLVARLWASVTLPMDVVTQVSGVGVPVV